MTDPIYTAMSTLTGAIQRLTQHMEDADAAAQQRARQTTNDQQVTARSQTQAAPVAATPPPAGTSGSQSTPDQAAATARQQLADQQASQAAQRTNTGGSTPPDAAPVVQSGSEAPGTPGLSSMPSMQEAMTWAMLGPHGGPFGDLRMQQFALQRNLGWASNASSALNSYLTSNLGEYSDVATGETGYSEDPSTFNTLARSTLGGVDTALNWAKSPKGQAVTLGGIAAYRGLGAITNMTDDWRQAGLQLGYGGPGSGGQGFLGLNINPLAQSSATAQGASLALERKALEGWSGGISGMTSAQSDETVAALAGQGWSNEQGGLTSINGSNTTIAENLMRPMVNMGVQPEDAAQWTPALRNANVSIQQLMQSIGQIPALAQAAHETVGSFNASLLQLAQTQVSEGGTMQGAAQTGTTFTQTTGMAPGVFGQLSQSPLYTGMMMMQNGVLPSDIPNLSSGSQMQGMLSTLGMLQGAFKGMGRSTYTNVPGVGRVQMSSGQTAMEAQMGQMLGLSTSDVHRLLEQMPEEQAITSATSKLGDPSMGPGQPGSGIYQFLSQKGAKGWGQVSSANQRKATTYFNDFESAATMRQQGLTDKEISQIKGTGNISQRMNYLHQDWAKIQQNSPYNQVGNTQTVNLNVKFTGAAARIFQQAGPATAKLAMNSGYGGLMNSQMNSPFGDALASKGSPGGAWGALLDMHGATSTGATSTGDLMNSAGSGSGYGASLSPGS